MTVRSIVVLFLFVAFASSPCLMLVAQDRAIRPITVQKKIALVIGNAAYSQAPLTNPIRDAAAVTEELKALGFTVLTGNNLSLPEFAQKVDLFTSQLQTGDLALFYYSGHGIQVNRENYLLPVEFQATREAAVPYTAFSASRVRDELEKSGAVLRILILDACRNNPFKGSKGGADGLAPMGSTAEGTLIAFATGDNNTASDNPGSANGLYTQYLLQSLRQPGRELHDIFRDVKRQVFSASNRQQNPFTYDDVAGDFYFFGGPSVPPTRKADADAWDRIRNSTNPQDFDDFATAFPNSDFSAAARLLATQLRRTLSAPLGKASRETVLPTPALNEPTQQNTKRVNPKDGLTYVWIPPGNGINGFFLGQTDVTQAAYQLVTGKNPSHFQGAQLPVDSVNWNEARAYCQAIGGRLPEDMEWKYAARGGTTGETYGSVDAIAWYTDNSEARTHEVGQKQPNAYGLYDMLGNVWQWTADSDDGRKHKLLRGGSYSDYKGSIGVSSSNGYAQTGRLDLIGFRCVG